MPVHKSVSEIALSRVVPDPSEEEASLVSRARGGDRAAADTLVRRHLRDVYELALRLLNDPDLAQDVTQEAFVSALNGLPRFRGEASFRTWLMRITVNAARTAGRSRGRRREIDLRSALHVDDGSPDPSRRAVDLDEAARVDRELARLPGKQRLAVALRLKQGMSYSEIAVALDCSEGAARVNYHLGIKRLREALHETRL